MPSEVHRTKLYWVEVPEIWFSRLVVLLELSSASGSSSVSSSRTSRRPVIYAVVNDTCTNVSIKIWTDLIGQAGPEGTP